MADLFLIEKGNSNSGWYGPPRGDHGRGSSTKRTPNRGKVYGDEEAYQWHETGEVREWAIGLSKEDRYALGDYCGFGYSAINGVLRGNVITRIEERDATPEERKRLVDNDYRDIELGDGRTLTFGGLLGKVRWEVPDEEYMSRNRETGNRINDLIANRGIVLKENTEVKRAAYLPGVDISDLEGSIDSIRTEKGFTSTFLGPAQGRAEGTGYVSYGVAESKYKRFNGDINHKEIGTAVSFEIVLPKGAKVASIEAARRSRKYSDGSYDLDNKAYRSESEILIGSGANFKVLSVTRIEPLEVGDHNVPHARVRMVYIGGGSSAK